MKRKSIRQKMNFGPITIMLFLSVLVMVLSFILNKLQFKSYMTDYMTFETTIVTVKNIFSKEGIQYIFGDSITNFRALEPLAFIIISLASVSILEVSGLLQALFGKLKNVKPFIITFAILFISIISSIIGEYSYAILFPLAAILYKIIGKDPKFGIYTVFIGVTMGYASSFIFSAQDIALGRITESTALDVISNYSFENNSLIFIQLVSIILLSVIGTILIEKNLSKKAKRNEEEEYIYSPKALRATGIVFVILMLIVAYSIIPGFPGSGFLLGDSNEYIDRIFGSTSPFKEGFLLLFTIVALICGYVYGHISRNIKNSKEYSQAIASTFENTGFIFAGLFFFSIMVGIIKWTGISDVISLKLINFIAGSKMSGIFLVIALLLIGIIMTILNPAILPNWTLAAPTFVPLMVYANISPSFAMMVFKVADSIGKCFTPMFVYLIVMIGFLYKYDTQNEDITLFGTMRKIMPVTIWLALVWIALLIGWNLLGLQLGVGTPLTL